MELLNGVPNPHILSTFLKYCCQIWAYFARKHPIPHTFCVILITDLISHPVLQISPPFCVHTIPHSFSIYFYLFSIFFFIFIYFQSSIPHQILFEHATSHFGRADPPGLPHPTPDSNCFPKSVVCLSGFV